MIYLQMSKFALSVDSDSLSLTNCINEAKEDQDVNGKQRKSEDMWSQAKIKANKIYGRLVLSSSAGCCKTMCLSVKGTGISCVGYTYHPKGNQCLLKVTNMAEPGAEGAETSLPQTGTEYY